MQRGGPVLPHPLLGALGAVGGDELEQKRVRLIQSILEDERWSESEEMS